MVYRKSKARSCLTTLALHVALSSDVVLLGRQLIGLRAYFTRDTVSTTGKIIRNLCAVNVQPSFSSRVRAVAFGLSYGA